MCENELTEGETISQTEPKETLNEEVAKVPKPIRAIYFGSKNIVLSEIACIDKEL